MNSNGTKSLISDLSLLFAAFIWGTGFVANQYALDSGMKTSFIMLMRFGIAMIIMGLIFYRKIKNINKNEIRKGLIAGSLLFASFYFQTIGLYFTTPSSNAFITATNVIMVPFITWIFLKKRPQTKFFLLAFSTFTGVAILSYSLESGLDFNIGDSFTLLCAFLFAAHISYLDMASKEIDVIKLTFLQIATAAMFSLIVFVFFDAASVESADFAAGIWPVLHLGILSTLLCFFIQTAALKHTNSTKAAIFISTEALFGALFSVLLGLEPFTMNLLLGGSVVLCSIFSSEIKR